MATSNIKNVKISPEPTPNPASVRFLLDQPLLESGTADLADATQAARSPLAQRLFALDDVSAVFLAPNFVTVTAGGETDWSELAPKVMAEIRDHYQSDEPSLVGEPDAVGEGEGDVAKGILRVIDEEIRPAVNMDGGDVTFGGYENGIVHLFLRGACSGCPSARMTLKLGIERRLKEEFPEIKAVEAM
ncbi:MAG: NifU family protein [bacterium]|nr:NifU family protein [bacterium]